MPSHTPYSAEGFWRKVQRFAKRAGRELVETALKLYYAAQHPATPAWARSTVYAALAYFISPIDAVPDFLPGGFADDLAVLAAAVVIVAAYITPDIARRAKTQAAKIFGDDDQADSDHWSAAA